MVIGDRRWSIGC